MNSAITEISLTNFKAFRRTSIELSGLTLLTGENSSGKSSVIQSVAVLRQSFDSGALMEKSEPSLSLNGELVMLGTGRDVLHESFGGKREIGIQLTIDSIRRIEWLGEYEPHADSLLTNQLSSDDREVIANVNVFGAKTFQYLRADRLSPSVSFPRSYDHTVRKRRLGSLGEYTTHYLVEFGDDIVAPAMRSPSLVSPQLLDQVNAWLSEISNGVHIEPRYLEGTDSVQLSFGYGGRAGVNSTNLRRPTNVGFGLTYSLPIIVALLSAKPGDFIMIENPEAHLHPRGQSTLAILAGKASSMGAQIVIETHSDHVLNAVRLSVKREEVNADQVRIHFSTREGEENRFVSPRISPSGRLDSWPRGFFDEYERSIEGLLS